MEFAPTPLSGNPNALFHFVVTAAPGAKPNPKMVTRAHVISGGSPAWAVTRGSVETEISLTPTVGGHTSQGSSMSTRMASLKCVAMLALTGVFQRLSPAAKSSGVTSSGSKRISMSAGSYRTGASVMVSAPDVG